ncbi:MAG: DNA polymerase IV, partial [Clostridiales bacterium]|nr:DNA polymerase IV [Clostridiales bacterium]
MRVILHSDLNAFYANVECLYRPELRNIPMAVCGDPAIRHGIVLARNELAKKSGVRTGEVIWQALVKCPSLKVVAPHGYLYLHYSQLVRGIYEEYTPYVEPFGIDECWLDLTGADRAGVEIAEEIRRRIRDEIGLTVSIGVSFNKIFAKLGSDLNKPDAVSEIRQDNFRAIVWPLPVRALLFVGRQTEKKLGAMNVRTIGDLVRCGPDFLRLRLGKAGLMFWQYAMGLERSEVAGSGAYPQVKSIGNSMTTARDLHTEAEVKQVLMRLADKVASRLREQELCCATVQISLRDSDLFSWERQRKLERPTQCSVIILEEAMNLYKSDRCNDRPLRSLGIRATD